MQVGYVIWPFDRYLWTLKWWKQQAAREMSTCKWHVQQCTMKQPSKLNYHSFIHSFRILLLTFQTTKNH